MLSRKHSTALSLIASAIISSSLLGTIPSGTVAAGAGGQIMPAVLQEATSAAQAAGWAAPSGTAARPIATPVSAVASFSTLRSNSTGLTDAEVQKMDLYLQKYEKDLPFAANVIDVLGLAKLNTVVFRQLSANDDNDTVHYHYFNRSKSDPNVIVFMYQDTTKNVVNGYRVDTKLNYVIGYVSPGVPQKLADADGKTGLAAELKWWANNMDNAPAQP